MDTALILAGFLCWTAGIFCLGMKYATEITRKQHAHALARAARIIRITEYGR